MKILSAKQSLVSSLQRTSTHSGNIALVASEEGWAGLLFHVGEALRDSQFPVSRRDAATWLYRMNLVAARQGVGN